MVRKLIKHELYALYRWVLGCMAAVLLLGVLARIVGEVLDANVTENVNIGLSMLAQTVSEFWTISLLLLIAAGTFVSAARFYKSLFTGEGYLTFSLPLTPAQLLLGKFLAALIVNLSCYAVAGLSLVIGMRASAWPGALEWADMAFHSLWIILASDPIVFLELALLFIGLLPTGLLYLYLVTCIGQLFTKGRIAVTVCLFYGSGFALGVLFALLFVPIMLLANISPHLVVWLFILAVYAFDAGSFFLIRFILMHKVNLVV